MDGRGGGLTGENEIPNLPLMINGLYLWGVVSAVLLTISSVAAQEDVKPVEKLTLPKQPASIRGWYDIPARDYSDLMPHYREVPTELNAVPLLLAVEEGLVEWREMQKRLRKFKTDEVDWDQEYWTEAFKKNEVSIILLDRALKRPWLQIPLLESPSDEITGLLVAARLMDLKEMQFVQHLEKGEPDEALVVLKDYFRLSEMCLHSDGALVAWLMAVACYERSFLMADYLGGSPACQMEHLKEVELLLADLNPVIDRFQEAFRMELRVYFNFLSEHYRGNDDYLLRIFGGVNTDESGYDAKAFAARMGTILFLQPNRTNDMYAEMIRYIIGLAAAPRWKRGDVFKPEAARFLDQDMTVWSYISPNTMGRSLFKLSMPIMGKQVNKIESYSLRLEVSRTLCALRRYQLKQGNLPRDLTELVPVYMAQMPLDPYDGKPLRYSREKKRLWSVGEDGQDEGGLDSVKPFASIRKMKNEPTFLIRFPDQ